jgi:hypothetical protein
LTKHKAGGGEDINALRGFDPFTGQLGVTQNELLTGGLKTDVSGATEAARILGGQEFDAASDKINELLASKGLLSSTARTEAIAREKAKLAERIAAAGLQAEIAASEAAAGRTAGAVTSGLTGTGQQLTANQAAGQLSLGQTGQELSGLVSAGQGAGTSAGLNTAVQTTGETTGSTTGGTTNFGFPPSSGQPNAFGAATPTSFRGNALAATAIPTGPTFAPAPTFSGVSASSPSTSKSILGGGGALGATGGSVPSLKEFEAWLEKQGRSTLDAFGPEAAPISDPQEKRRIAVDIAVRNLGGPEEAFRLFSDPELQAAAKAEGRRKRAAQRGVPQTTSGHGAGGKTDVTDLISGFNSLRTLGKGVRFNLDPEASEFVEVRDTDTGELIDPSTGKLKNPPKQDPNAFLQQGSQGGEFFQSGGPVNPPNTVPMNRPTANLADLGIAHPTAIESRRQFFEQGGDVQGNGGEVPGVDTGQDRVPAMLRSEELVVTPELVESIQAAQTPDQAMAVVEALKVLAQKPLEFDPEAGEHVAQTGGQLGSIGGAGREFGVDPLEPSIGQRIQAFIEQVLGPAGQGAPKQEFGQLDQGPREPLEGPPEPPPLQRAMQTVDVADLRKPEFMDFRGPDFPESSQIVPGVGGASPTLRVRGPGAHLVGDQQAGKGTISQFGTPVMTEDELQMARIERAKSRRDLIQHAMIVDPVGGPEKFARLNNALQNADREVEGLVNEVVAKEKNRIAEREAAATELFAKANLSNATANRLQAEAQKATAFAGVAEKLQNLAASDPQAAFIIEMFSKMNPEGERGEARMEAAMKMLLAPMGLEIKEHGFFGQLFGKPQFEFLGEVKPLNVGPEMAALLQQMNVG